MQILLYGFNDDYYFEVAKLLIKQKKPITHLVTYFPNQYQRSADFKNCVIIDQARYSYADQILNLNNDNTAPLSESVIQDYAAAETLFLSITDRLAYRPSTVTFRKELYYQLLQYWLDFFDRHPITAVCFNHTPHTGESNVVYDVAQKRGLTTLTVAPTLIKDRVLVQRDYKQAYQLPNNYLATLSKKQIIHKIGAEYYQTATQQAEWLQRSIEINQEVMRNEHDSIFLRVIKRNVTHLSLKRLASSVLSLTKLNQGSMFFLEKPAPRIIEYLYIFDYYLKRKKLTTFHDSLASTPSFKTKYVYFSLHVQPERTTMPEAGVFYNQLLALDILAKSIPKGWKVYVKEHPRQFVPTDIRFKNFRDRYFYTKITSYPNVVLVKRSTPSQQLITHAVATATMTGSVGWESLLLNKCCIVFGHPWYQACDSALLVKSREDCQKAINTILSKSKKTIEMDVLKFLAYFKTISTNSAHYHNLAVRSELDYQLLVNNLTNDLIKQFT